MRGYLTEEEKKNKPKVTGALLRRILSYLTPYRVQFFFVFVAILLAALVGLLPSILTGKIVDEALVDRNMQRLITLCFAAFGAVALSQLIGVAESYINSWISQRIIYDMKNEMFRHLTAMPHAFFASERQGEIITRMNTDISGVSTVISGTLASAVSNIATVVTTVVALFSMSWQLALIGMLILPLLILPSRRVGRTRFQLLTESQEKNDALNQIINETLSVSGSLLVKLFTREDAEYANFQKVNEAATQVALKEARSGRWFRVAMGMLTQLGPLLIYLAGGYFLIRGWDPTLSIGTITATVALLNRLYRPVESLLDLGVNFTRSLALFTRIFDYLDRPVTISSPENGLQPELAMQEIRYEHVAFAYVADRPILTDVNFTVPGGAMYAIVGPSGSGKSTVVNMIPRLYDALAGRVTIAGVDVREMDLAHLRGSIGMVTQESYLFNGTIRENLLYARPGATEAELRAACEKANIWEFIQRQPKGLDTEVGNRGLKLSGGEKQRISIARVILKDPAILILDEATSALDSISEEAIQKALDAMMVGRTTLVIAHRLSTILQADQILVVAGGVIAEQGTHAELLAQDGIYRDLYETQFKNAVLADPAEADLAWLSTLSTEYNVRQLEEAEIGDVYRLARANRRFYRQEDIRPGQRNLTDVLTRPGAAGAGSDSAGDGVAAMVAVDAPTSPTDAALETPTSPTDAVIVAPQHLLGFYDAAGQLVAVLDLILDYPAAGDVFIGWFMVSAPLQRQGIGSQLFADIRAALHAQGYARVAVPVWKENDTATAFWAAQGFVEDGLLRREGRHEIYRMVRTLDR